MKTTMITTDIAKAVEILRNGGLVAFPTETVYGLGADATNEAAVRKIFAAKERPYDHPLIVHLASVEQLPIWAKDISSDTLKLADNFWPGPLTLILKKQLAVLERVTGGQQSIGLRIPNHPIASQLLQAFGGGIAAPSANKFTRLSATTAEAVLEELGDAVDLVLDGGDCEIGLESTILDMTNNLPVMLRPGVITTIEIERVLGVTIQTRREAKPTTRAPGMHYLHYAPRTKTQLVETQDIPQILNTNELPIALLLRSDVAIDTQVEVVKMPNDAAAYAKLLYQTLRNLDSRGFQQIYVEALPDTLEWAAIRDRLSKAAS